MKEFAFSPPVPDKGLMGPSRRYPASFEERWRGISPSRDPNVLKYDPSNTDKPAGGYSPAGMPDPTQRQYFRQNVKISEGD